MWGDLAERAARDWGAAATDFLTPPERAEAEAALAQLADVRYARVGGRVDAERQRLVAGRAEVLEAMCAGEDGDGAEPCGALVLAPAAAADFVCVVGLYGDFRFASATQRDFLGALCSGEGLSRAKLGDVVVVDECVDTGARSKAKDAPAAYVVCDPTTAEVLSHGGCEGELRVRGVRVHAEALPYERALAEVPPPQRGEPFDVAVGSMPPRLDAVLAAGLKLSRAGAAELMAKRGGVRLNWGDEAPRAGAGVREGDVLSVRGVGRLEVLGVNERARGGGARVTLCRRGS